MPATMGNPRDKVREIGQEALSRREEMSLDGLVDEIMEAAGDGIKNYAIGFMASSFMRRDGITLAAAQMKAESALKEAGLCA